MKRIGFALLMAALIWTLVHTLELVAGITPGYGRWVAAALTFLAIVWLTRARP